MNYPEAEGNVSSEFKMCELFPAPCALEAPLKHLQVSGKMYQTVFDLNNWWMYDREMVRAMIDRTEQVHPAETLSHAVVLLGLEQEAARAVRNCDFHI